MTTLIDIERRWVCPNCDYTRLTKTVGTQAVIHTCPGLRGLIAPLVEEGTRCRVEAREREDYLNGDSAQLDDAGRPIMSIVTIRDDGQDCRVLAPLPTLKGRAHGLD